MSEQVKIGIIGSGADKFTPYTELIACRCIEEIVEQAMVAWHKANPEIYDLGVVIVSGHSPVGGVDLYAEEVAHKFHLQTDIKAPKVLQWDPPGGYGFKARNLDIARDSDVVIVIVAHTYPRDYHGHVWDVCYHCAKSDRPLHTKSGACWTAIKAMKMGKLAIWHVIHEDGTIKIWDSEDHPNKPPLPDSFESPSKSLGAERND